MNEKKIGYGMDKHLNTSPNEDKEALTVPSESKRTVTIWRRKTGSCGITAGWSRVKISLSPSEEPEEFKKSKEVRNEYKEALLKALTTKSKNFSSSGYTCTVKPDGEILQRYKYKISSKEVERELALIESEEKAEAAMLQSGETGSNGQRFFAAKQETTPKQEQNKTPDDPEQTAICLIS